MIHGEWGIEAFTTSDPLYNESMSESALSFDLRYFSV